MNFQFKMMIHYPRNVITFNEPCFIIGQEHQQLVGIKFLDSHVMHQQTHFLKQKIIDLTSSL